MEVDLMRFLFEVRTRLSCLDLAPADDASDLQAVERALPDTDWFELEEVRDVADGAGLAFAGGAEPQLEF